MGKTLCVPAADVKMDIPVLVRPLKSSILNAIAFSSTISSVECRMLL